MHLSEAWSLDAVSETIRIAALRVESLMFEVEVWRGQKVQLWAGDAFCLKKLGPHA